MQTVEQQSDDSIVNTNTNDEYRVQPDETAADDNELTNNNTRTQIESRNNSTRYNLRAEPSPKIYRDILVHELQVKPVLLKFTQDEKIN